MFDFLNIFFFCTQQLIYELEVFIAFLEVFDEMIDPYGCIEID